MTRRERYLRILSKQKADRLVWAPNFDHWLAVNTANGTVPPEYRGMSRNDIVRRLGATIWARTTVLREIHPHVNVRTEEEPGKWVRTTYETPVGCVETFEQYAEDSTRALFLKGHRVKRREDIAVIKFIAEDTQYVLDPEPLVNCERDVGDDGVSLIFHPCCVPFIQFGKTDAGWEQGIYLWNDYTQEVEELLEVYTAKAIEATHLICQTPCMVVHSGDNMDELTMSPRLFQQYAVPYYRKVSNVLHEAGKIFEVHWCGRTRRLLPLLPGTGVDVVEAVVPVPMSDLTIPEALSILRGHVVIQGGIPAVLMCEQGGSRDRLRTYVQELLRAVPHGEWFVLGMSDNVPPDADFERVRIISEMVNRYGGR